MATYSVEHGITPIELLGSPLEFADYLKSTTTHISNLKIIITKLISVGEAKRGFPLLLEDNVERLVELAKEESTNSKQHPVIPTRIYSELISRTIDEFEEIETIIEPLVEVIRQCSTNPLIGRSRRRQRELSGYKGLGFKQSHPDLPELLDEFGLSAYIEKYTQKTEFSNYKTTLQPAHLVHIQGVCFLLISLLSGMRNGEISRLPFDCLETYYENHKKYYRICGATFKFSDGLETRVKWVTDPIIERVIHVAQKIAVMLYSLIGVSLSKTQRLSSDYPLFITVSCIPHCNQHYRLAKEAPYTNTKLQEGSVFLEHLFAEITEEDIQELEAIDPFRDWRSEENMTIGSRWHYSSHQSRRSLSVYASASGIVTLPSLKRQLHHLTEDMTIHYAKGSAFAKTMISANQDHFCKDYQSAQPEAQALAYIALILMCDEPLFGGHGAWVSRRFDQTTIVTTDDRATTMRRFKNGEIMLRDTAMGSCTSIEPCEKKAMRTVSACIPCAKAVIKPSKLEKVIKIHRVHVSRLDPDSVEAKLKREDLTILIDYQDHISKKMEKSRER